MKETFEEKTMTFKTKQELKKEFENTGAIVGIEESFKSFKERIELYLTYKGNPIMMWKDVIKTEAFRKRFCQSYDVSFDYNDWLFNYCFGHI